MDARLYDCVEMNNTIMTAICSKTCAVSCESWLSCPFASFISEENPLNRARNCVLAPVQFLAVLSEFSYVSIINDH